MLVIWRKGAENTFIMERSVSPVRHQNMGGFLTVLPEFLEINILSYASFSL
jgi:hypothetical protein